MNCREFLHRHSEYVDALIEPAEAARLRAHAAACPACARYDRVVRRGGQLARELLPRVQVSEDFEPRVRHRLLHVRDQMSRRRAGGASFYAAAASVLLIAAGTAAMLTMREGRAPVVRSAAVLPAPAPALTPLRGAARSATDGPALPIRALEGVPATALIAAPAEAPAAHLVSAAGWPVYSSRAIAAAFPAPHASLVVSPAESRHAGVRRGPAGPLLVRH